MTLQRIARGRAVRKSQNYEEARRSADTTDNIDRETEAGGSEAPLSEPGKDVVEVQPDGSFVTRMDPSLEEKGQMRAQGGNTIADEDQDDQDDQNDQDEDDAGDTTREGAIEADGD